MTETILCIDLGGTKILAALVSESGKVLARDYALTASGDDCGVVVEQIEGCLSRVKASVPTAKPSAVCAAVAGIIDSRKGAVTTSPNLPRWKDVPLKAILERRLGLRVHLLNDATAAALGEHRLGAGRGTSSMVFLTVSTGVGGGLVIGGRLYEGADGAAGEIGHMVVKEAGPRCGCGNFGCLEALVSGTAMAREAGERLAAGEASMLAGSGVGAITAQTIHGAALDGDPMAQDIISRAAHYLGVGLANLVNIFNPDAIVVGGGVSNMGDMLLEPARGVVREKAFRLPANSARIVPAALGADAGIVGAAIYALEGGSQAGC